MPRLKKTEDVDLETTEPTDDKTSVEDFKRAVIEVGMQICSDYKEGRIRPEAPLVSALTELFKAVKD